MCKALTGKLVKVTIFAPKVDFALWPIRPGHRLNDRKLRLRHWEGFYPLVKLLVLEFPRVVNILLSRPLWVVRSVLSLGDASAPRSWIHLHIVTAPHHTLYVRKALAGEIVESSKFAVLQIFAFRPVLRYNQEISRINYWKRFRKWIRPVPK